ncbi:tetratricopeptide repeat protein [Acaryochloris sp. IP29b_bin.148]|uniref:tetratricopeptide repeat protein n=1 Tax=Acaryochloris sp. IP29b_bin.148 TaxID=2969218 RepID=UPI0026114176|nr:tetratricopeptide repeat protein [Acaryochloris sp. IP29b_bin.148]
MSLLFGDAPKALNLLSIGERGVGKTVFLVGSYTESNSSYEGEQQNQLWFDCQDQEAHENIQGVMNYIAQTGQYPPPTMKISGFNFSLKQQRFWGTQTLCYFRWWDMPGEICDIQNNDFQSMILSSQGCCVFINAYALINDPTYLESVKDVIELVTAIASLVKHHRLQYPMALIFTQCDRLEAGPLGQLQIEKCLEPLIIRLDNARSNYRRFYSSIPIVRTDGMPVLRATGSADALVWITSELCRASSVSSGQDLAAGLSQGSSLKKFVHTVNRKPAITMGLIAAGVVGLIAIGFALTSIFSNQQPQQAKASQKTVQDHKEVLEADPDNVEALTSVADHYEENGQPEKAIPPLEKVVAQQPNDIILKAKLADLYELTGQKPQAEKVYDDMLALQPQNFKATLGKAVLRGEAGDTEAAESWFQKAEKIAGNDEKIKTQVQELAAQTLQSQ